MIICERFSKPAVPSVQLKEPTIIARRGTFLFFGRAVEWLQNVVFANDYTFLTGRGPGTVREQFQYLSYNAFDTTRGEIVYEYGLVAKEAKGLRFAMVTLIFCSVVRAGRGNLDRTISGISA